MDAEPTILPATSSAEIPPGYPEEVPPGLTPLQKEQIRRQRMIIITLIIIGVILVVAIIASLVYLTQPGTDTARIRDIMIIFMAFEMMILGVAMVILMIQLATLINLLQNDIKPILDATNETANTLRGTALFLSNNLSEPVIKLNEYASGLYRFMEIIGLARRR
jgi:hypothetical protein